MSRNKKGRFHRKSQKGVELAPQESLVSSEERLAEIVELIREAGRVAVDTEFHAERVYHPRLYLVQVAVGDRAWAADPTEVDVRPLVEVLAEPGIETVVHAGGMDIGIFYGQFGVLPSQVFDTQVAAGFAGFAFPRSLAKLTSAVLGVELRKGQALSDWSQRPLSAKQLGYALEDVRYLFALREAFMVELEARGRLEWFENEMKERNSVGRIQLDPAERYRRISGWARLPGVGRAVLRELACSREAIASERNRPVQQVIDDGLMLELARLRPRDLDTLSENRRFKGSFRASNGAWVLEAIEEGIACPEDQQPERRRDDLSKTQQTLAELLTAAVRIYCKEQGIAFELVEARTNIRKTVRAMPSSEEEARGILSGWRADFLAGTLSGFLSGQLALALDRSTKGARFVELDSGSAGANHSEPGPDEP